MHLMQGVESARREGRPAYLRHLPYGIWLSMAKYDDAPFVMLSRAIDLNEILLTRAPPVEFPEGIARS